jgi:hypothetical protein
MSLWTEPADRFLVGKLMAGLLFIASFFTLLVAVTTTLLPGVQPWGGAVLGDGLSCLLWLGVFQIVERRRQASSARIA